MWKRGKLDPAEFVRWRLAAGLELHSGMAQNTVTNYWLRTGSGCEMMPGVRMRGHERENVDAYTRGMRSDWHVNRRRAEGLLTPVRQFAAGGTVHGGGTSPYIVGERGPELFTPRSDGHITANRDIIDYDRLAAAIAANPPVIAPDQVAAASLRASPGERAWRGWQ